MVFSYNSLMKCLVAYYSRTGNTKKVGELISEELKCDSEEIIDTVKRTGFKGWIRCSKDVLKNKMTVLQEINKKPDSYDLIIIGTPIWGDRISTPIRTYLHEYKSRFKEVAFFLYW